MSGKRFDRDDIMPYLSLLEDSLNRLSQLEVLIKCIDLILTHESDNIEILDDIHYLLFTLKARYKLELEELKLINRDVHLFLRA